MSSSPQISSSDFKYNRCRKFCKQMTEVHFEKTVNYQARNGIFFSFYFSQMNVTQTEFISHWKSSRKNSKRISFKWIYWPEWKMREAWTGLDWHKSGFEFTKVIRFGTTTGNFLQEKKQLGQCKRKGGAKKKFKVLLNWIQKVWYLGVAVGMNAWKATTSFWEDVNSHSLSVFRVAQN